MKTTLRTDLTIAAICQPDLRGFRNLVGLSNNPVGLSNNLIGFTKRNQP
ncbi:MAG: hypothetical protein H6601_02375 [Flavobacteriales bacterium]|nr:hypothetical protein [Flavobacteriales bacterium]